MEIGIKSQQMFFNSTKRKFRIFQKIQKLVKTENSCMATDIRK